MTITFGHDPVQTEVAELLQRLERGDVVDRTFERRHVDLKEEAGRRGRRGEILPGSSENEDAAQQLAAEAACMANTPGGGALIVGIADNGALIGSRLDGEWLRHRIYQITGKLLTVEVAEAVVRDTRLLVVTAPRALEPIRVKGRIHWRVDDHCVEVDATTWHAKLMQTMGYDWSSQASSTPVGHVRPQAIAVARDFLRERGDQGTDELADVSDRQLLRRLNVVTQDGMLTNAGVLAFIGRDAPCLDYIRRDYAGGDSTARARRSGRSLLEELAEVFFMIDANNPTRHLPAGLVMRQVRDLPLLAAREAVVNGVAHRDWMLQAPTVVEHIGRTLRVTSPGGFFGGVNESNIITHPSRSRNPSLTQLLADLRVAEREGIGVDRMVREMIRLGHQPPAIREISGPYVRASLVGETVDEPWLAWLGAIEPATESSDVSSLLILRTLVDVGWIDEHTAVPLIQLPVEEARGAILKFTRATLAGAPVMAVVDGTPEGSSSAWRLSTSALDELISRDRAAGRTRVLPTRPQIALSYAESRGRISSTELASLVGASAPNVNSTLKSLAAAGHLVPSTPAGRGRGFFYRWAE